jgi:hypothetical protein
LSCASSAAGIASFVRFLAMPKLAPSPTLLPAIYTDYYRDLVLAPDKQKHRFARFAAASASR